MRVFLLLFFCISLNCLGRGIEFNIENFMGRYCTDCHDEDIQKGDRRFDDLSTSITDIDLADRWQEVLDVLNLGEMPPKKKEQPSKNELFGAIDWLTEKLKKAESDLKGHTSTVVMRRMTREEYDQTVHSIFGFESKRFSPARHLPKDETYHGFKNIGEAQITSAFYLNSALEAATEIVNFTLAKGDEKPQVKTVHMPPKSYRTDYGRTSIWREYRKNVISLFNNSPIQAKAMSRNLADGVHADGFYEFEVEAEA